MTISLPLPTPFDGVNFSNELAEAGRGDIFFYTADDKIIFQEEDDMLEWLIGLLTKHDPRPKPPAPTAAEARLANLEKWAAATDDAMNQLILDALFASLSDEDLLADLGGL